MDDQTDLKNKTGREADRSARMSEQKSKLFFGRACTFEKNFVIMNKNCKTGCGSVWLECTAGGREVAGSNPVTPSLWRDGHFRECLFFCPILEKMIMRWRKGAPSVIIGRRGKEKPGEVIWNKKRKY